MAVECGCCFCSGNPDSEEEHFWTYDEIVEEVDKGSEISKLLLTIILITIILGFIEIYYAIDLEKLL